uniref:Uncharacterized protein n=1 Tax=Anopheles farauti TaxID=69004 RepID=A0A182QT81_9DIPT
MVVVLEMMVRMVRLLVLVMTSFGRCSDGSGSCGLRLTDLVGWWVGKHLLVAVTFTLYLTQDVDAVVVAQGTRHLVVVHREVVLLLAPQLRQPGGIDDLKHARIAALPRDVAAVPLARIVQELLQKVPQQAAV